MIQPTTPNQQQPSGRRMIVLGIIAGIIIFLIAVGIFVAPMVLAPPVITDLSLEDNATQVNPQAAIQITFNQWVDPQSLQQAVTFDPPVAFTVEGTHKSVRIQPQGGLQYGTSYNMTISAAVTNRLGRTMQQSLERRFTTAPYVQIASYEPASGATEVTIQQPVMITFNAPVVSPEEIAQAADNPAVADTLPQPLHLESDATGTVAGVGRWLSPMLFGFYPDGGLHIATTYTARVDTTLQPDGSARLEHPHEWSFATETTLAMQTRPDDGTTDVSPHTPIEVRFAPDVDVATASQLFTLVDTTHNTPVAGAIKTSTTSFLFEPESPLQRDTTYLAQLAAGIRTTTGAILTADQRTWTFTTMGNLEILQVEPRPNSQEVLTDTHRITVRFNHPVIALTTLEKQASLPHPLTITPDIPGEGYWLDTSTYVYVPAQGLDPSTRYQVRVAADLTDQTGSTLAEAYTWNFTTITPQVAKTEPDDRAEYVDPQAMLHVYFNQPMSRASIRNAISLISNDTGAYIATTITMEENGLEQATHAIVTPSSPLERGGDYTLLVSRDARATHNNAPLANEYRTSFQVAPSPWLIGTEPFDGATAVDPARSLQLAFSTPMDWVSVSQNLTIEPQPGDVFTFTDQTELSVYALFEPETDYVVTIGADARDQYGMTLGQAATLSFRTSSLPPSLSLIGAYDIGSYNAHTSLRVPVRLLNINKVRYRLYELDPQQATRMVSDYEAWQAFEADPSPSSLVKQGSANIRSTANREQIDKLPLGTLPPGLYYLYVESADTIVTESTNENSDSDSSITPPFDRQIMVVTPNALTIKRNADSLFLWTIDMESGKPVADLPFTAAYASYDDENNVTIHTQDIGVSNNQGIVQTSFSAETPYTPMFIWSPDGDQFVYATTNWDDGIAPWNFDLPVEYQPRTLRGGIATDRPIYRPQQTVHIRGAVRVNDTESYRLPDAGHHIWIKIVDPKDNTVFSAAMPLNEFGTFNTSIALDSTAEPGQYNIYLADTIEQQETDQMFAYGTFTVANYRKPAFEVVLTPDQPELVSGETLNVAVDARYFAGGAIADAPVRWWLTTEPLFFSSESAPGFRFDNLDDAYAWYRQDQTRSGPQLVSEGTATTDNKGTLTLRLPTTQDKKASPTSQMFLLSVEVTDRDGQIIAADMRVPVHAGAFYIGLKPKQYVAEVGKPHTIDVLTIDSILDKSVGNRTLDIAIYRREWLSVQEQGSDGQMYWTSSYSDTLVETQSATTNERGQATVHFTPAESGSYRIGATATDDNGNTIATSVFTWAYGSATTFWGMSNSNRIDLVADKDRYQPGDTATILIPAPYDDMVALVTTERASIIEHQVIEFHSSTETLRIPIKDSYVPNVYLSVVLVRPSHHDGVADVRVGMVNLPVATEHKNLTIRVTPDKQQTGPREDVTYTVKATDSSGQGVRAEVSLALVDKAVLSLADDSNPSLKQIFYDTQAAGVFTAQSLTALVDRVSLRLDDGAKGGGGGLGADMLVRRDFPDTAYWNPTLVTANDGTATITVTLPDNLTTWRMTARAITADTLVGDSSSDILATQSLLIRPTLPRFLTAGDKPVIQAVVHNASDEVIDATATIQVSGLNITTPAEQQVRVPAQGQSVVRWNGEVVATEHVTIQCTVSGAGQHDSVEHMLPVQRFVTRDVVATAGQVYDTPVIETIALPTLPTSSSGTGTTDMGTLMLEIVPSLTASLNTGLDYLEYFPYGCTEQTTSRFLPTALIAQMHDKFKLDKPKLLATLEYNLTIGLQRLYSMQQLDGGWGWWASDMSNPYLTAYVIQGLLEAQQAGYGIDEHVLDDGLSYLQDQLLAAEETPLPAATRAYMLFVLAEAGKPDRGLTIALYEKHTQLPIYGHAYLLMTLQQLGGEDERVHTLVGELMSRAMLHATDAHWEEQETDYTTMSSTTRTTALALQALVRADPANFLVPNAVRYLMNQRRDGHWQTTQETAITLMALADYIAASGDLDADYTYRVLLDQRMLDERAIDEHTRDESFTFTLPLADLVREVNQAGQSDHTDQTASVQFAKQGSGNLYYTLRMRSYQPAEAVQPGTYGIGIRRDYIAVDATTLAPTGQVLSEATVGDVVQVQLTLTLPEEMHYLAVEDMLPAGLEALDSSLKTVSDMVQDPELQESSDTEDMQGWMYFAETEIHDNRVAMFATHLPSGTYRYTYLARAVIPGTYQTLPATAYQMYAPEVAGNSAGTMFVVR